MNGGWWLNNVQHKLLKVQKKTKSVWYSFFFLFFFLFLSSFVRSHFSIIIVWTIDWVIWIIACVYMCVDFYKRKLTTKTHFTLCLIWFCSHLESAGNLFTATKSQISTFDTSYWLWSHTDQSEFYKEKKNEKINKETKIRMIPSMPILIRMTQTHNARVNNQIFERKKNDFFFFINRKLYLGTMELSQCDTLFYLYK